MQRQPATDPRKLVALSKKASYLLRHGASTAGLPIRADGCVAVNVLLKKMGIAEALLEEIVARNDKQRFEFVVEEEQRYIRARNGHTLSMVQPQTFMKEVTDASEVANFHTIHCTFEAALPLILDSGLSRMQRHHVHFYALPRAGDLAKNPHRLLALPMQRDAYIELDTPQAMANGYRFFRQGDYLLCEGVNGLVPPAFFRAIYTKEKGGLALGWTGELAAAQGRCRVSPLLVLDFEANCVEKGRLVVNEIIEIPVVPVDVERGEVLDTATFHSFVAPTAVPLTSFATALCGIEPAALSGQPSLPEALDALTAHIQQHNLQEGVYITCGDFDLRGCLPREARFKNISVPAQLRRYINLKEVFATFMRGKHAGDQHFSMLSMLQTLDIKLEGRHHCGLDDARNLARVVVELRRRGCLFTKNYIKSAEG